MSRQIPENDPVIKYVRFLKNDFVTDKEKTIPSGSSVIIISEETTKNEFPKEIREQLLCYAEQAKSRGEIYVYCKANGRTTSFAVPNDWLG